MTVRHVICQKIQNFVYNEMYNLHVSAIEYNLPNLHKSSVCTPKIALKLPMSFAQFSFEIVLS